MEQTTDISRRTRERVEIRLSPTTLWQLAKADFRRRRCGKDYRVVCLKTIEVKRIIDFDTENRYEIYDEDWSDEGGEKNFERNAGLVGGHQPG